MTVRKATLLFLALAATACSSAAAPTSDAPEAASKFLGAWTYRSPSAITIDCPGAPERTIDLSKVPRVSQPGYFVFSAASADQIHEVDARGCRYDWAVSGDVAVAGANQSCASFPDGRGGSLLVQMQSGTKTTPDGASMNVDVHFATAAPESCAITVKGVAEKS